MEIRNEVFKIKGIVFTTKKEDKVINPIISLVKNSKTKLVWVDFIGFIPVQKKMGDYFHDWLGSN